MRAGRALAIALLLFSGRWSPLEAAEASGVVAGVQVTAREVLSAPAHGYAAYRVTLQSRSARAQTVTLRLPASSISRGRAASLEALTRTLVLPPRGAATVLLQHPKAPLFGVGLAVEVDGDRGEIPLGLSGGARGLAALEVLLSPALRDEDVRPLFALPAFEGPLPAGAPPRRSPSVPHRLTRWESLADWESSWLAYSGFDGVLLTEPELGALSDGAVAALRSFTLAGGTLVVLSGDGSDLRRRLAVREGGGLRADAARSWDLGFGRLVHVPGGAEALADLRPACLPDELRRTQAPFASDSVEPPDAFPEARPASSRGVFGLLVLFAFLIGPVNLYVCSRLGRKTLVLFTVPALSALATVGISAWAFLSEGWQRHLWRETLTLLDGETRAATTIGWTAAYCPIAPGEGLRFSSETELTPVLTGGSDRLALDWSEGEQHLARGWVSPRLPAFFRVRKAEARRERLEVSRDERGGLSALNGLGVPVERLVVADGQGGLHHAGGLAAGARAVLAPEPKPSPRTSLSARSLLGTTWNGLPGRLAEVAGELLPPGAFLAVLSRSPFLEDGLEGVGDRREVAVVIGLPAPGPPTLWPPAVEAAPLPEPGEPVAPPYPHPAGHR